MKEKRKMSDQKSWGWNNFMKETNNILSGVNIGKEVEKYIITWAIVGVTFVTSVTFISAFVIYKAMKN